MGFLFKESLIRRCAGVSHSDDLQRVLDLPRRSLNLEKVPDLTERLRTPMGTMKLWPIQSAALAEIERCNGGFFPIGVGYGKTLVSFLAGTMLNSRRWVLLVPPALRDQSHRALDNFSNLFQINPFPHIVAYSELSSARTADVLDRIAPDLIVADEAHSLKRRLSVRTRRFLRYMKGNPQTRFVALSGTMTTRSIKEFCHLIAIALREGAPVPFTYHELCDWADALDVSEYPAAPGALNKLCTEDGHVHEGVRSKFRCRLVSTPGVVATHESALGTSLVIRGLRPEVPKALDNALQALRSTWAIGDEEITDALSYSRVSRQLACGFYYRWVWPGGKDYEWLEARAAWHAEIRGYLTHSSRPGRDSPLLLARAAANGSWNSRHWGAWDKVRARPQPPTEAVWVSDALVKAAVAWAEEQDEGIIWYSHDALGQAIAEASGLKLFGAGKVADRELARTNRELDPVIICSAAAHGTGKNLQTWSNNLFTTIPNGAGFEQIIARTHRPGQLADEVNVDIWLHTPELEEAFETAVEQAKYIEATQGQKQKLLYATRIEV